MRQFWVVGGVYESTAFKNLADGSQEVREGPFDDYDKALKVWQRLAWETVDDANAHFHIEEDDMTAGGKGAFWVIGGSFKDTSFREWAGVPERHGPFETYAEAKPVAGTRLGHGRRRHCAVPHRVDPTGRQ